MGKNSKAKREAKQRREQRRRHSGNHSGPRFGPGHRPGWSRPTDSELIWAAADASNRRDPVLGELIAALQDRSTAGGELVRQLDMVIANVLARGGWLPLDVYRIVERKLPTAHRDQLPGVLHSAAARLCAGRPTDPRWLASHAAVGELVGAGSAAVPIEIGVELLAFLAGLPRLPETCPPPGAEARVVAGNGVDQAQLDKVRALLAKAESTTFPAEAEAYTAKAQQLIARHSIDASLLRGEASASEVTSTRIWLSDPYADAKATLLHLVARNSGGRSVHSVDMGFCTVFGFPDDLAAIELLYTSLTVQAVAAMTALGPQRDATGTSRTRSFRRSFLEGFAVRIGQRLREASQAALSAVTDELGEAALLPVLARRDDDVRAAQDAAFPQLTRRASAAGHNPAGWAAGVTAANLAHLGAAGEALSA